MYQREKHANTVLTVDGVIKKTSLGRSSIYSRLNKSSRMYDPSFPRQIFLGPRRVGWLESEVEAWLETQAMQRNREVA